MHFWAVSPESSNVSFIPPPAIPTELFWNRSASSLTTPASSKTPASPTVALKKDTDSAQTLTASYAFGFKREDLARVQLLPPFLLMFCWRSTAAVIQMSSMFVDLVTFLLFHLLSFFELYWRSATINRYLTSTNEWVRVGLVESESNNQNLFGFLFNFFNLTKLLGIKRDWSNLICWWVWFSYRKKQHVYEFDLSQSFVFT